MRKTLSAILAALLAVSLCACGNNAAESTSSPEPTATAEATATPTAEPTPTVPQLQLGDTIETDNFKMTLESVKVVSRHEYRTSANSTTYSIAENGYRYLLLQGHFENKSTDIIFNSSIVCTATINDVFTADWGRAEFIFERTYSSEIDPFTDVNYAIRISIPQKLAADLTNVVYTLQFDTGEAYTVIYDAPNATNEPTENSEISEGISTGKEIAESASDSSDKNHELNIGDTVTTDDYEMTLVSVGFSYDVLPSDTSGSYWHFAADSGKVYIDVVADVKNTMKRDITLGELYYCTGIYDNDYTYTSFTAVDDGDGDFLQYNSDVAAVPLATCKVHSLIECPAEVDESGKPVTIQFTIDQEEYEYKLR